MKGKKRSGGGAMKVSGNPNVFKEAAERKDGGKVESKGKVLGLMTGGGVRPRLDRPGRKLGGRVGADKSPLSTANKTSSPSPAPHSQEGGASD